MTFNQMVNEMLDRRGPPAQAINLESLKPDPLAGFIFNSWTAHDQWVIGHTRMLDKKISSRIKAQDENSVTFEELWTTK